MIGVYRVEFVRPRLSVTPMVPEPEPTPICMACAVGHHEQPILAYESCDCACHGTPSEQADYRVAA
jgi:hypothetical protein